MAYRRRSRGRAGHRRKSFKRGRTRRSKSYFVSRGGIRL